MLFESEDQIIVHLFLTEITDDFAHVRVIPEFDPACPVVVPLLHGVAQCKIDEARDVFHDLHWID